MKSLAKVLTFFLSFFSLVNFIFAVNQFEIIDDASSNSSFYNFRRNLIEAVNKKDKKFLLSIVVDNVVNTPGVGDSKANFIGFWEIDNPNSRIWEELDTILKLGAISGNNNSFWAPYLVKYNKVLTYDNLVIIANNVKLHLDRDEKSKVLKILSFDVVKSLCSTEEGVCDWDWMKVKTNTDEIGFVASNLVRSPFQYRIKFMKLDGSWKIVSFDSDF
jgi:hypothetical protein